MDASSDESTLPDQSGPDVIAAGSGTAHALRRITVAVTTTGARPAELERCVAAVLKQETPDGTEIVVSVVANGKNATELKQRLEADLNRLKRASEVPISIVCESRLGIPFARNRAIETAISNNADALAFVDDDAWPLEGWLIGLIEAMRDGEADGASGPQEPEFPKSTPALLKEAAIYKARKGREGAKINWAATNNVLFDLGLCQRSGLRFDPAFSAGGSDKAFFKAYVRAGGQLVWTNRARVTEPVVSSRLSVKWARERAWRMGVTGYTIERTAASPLGAFGICIAKAAGYMALSLRSLGMALVGRPHGMVDAQCHFYHAAGFVAGAFGVKKRAYT